MSKTDDTSETTFVFDVRTQQDIYGLVMARLVDATVREVFYGGDHEEDLERLARLRKVGAQLIRGAEIPVSNEMLLMMGIVDLIPAEDLQAMAESEPNRTLQVSAQYFIAKSEVTLDNVE